MRYILLLAIAIGCGKEPLPSSRPCDDLAITVSAAKQFLDLATNVRSSKPDVAITLCQAANTTIWQMGELLRLENRDDLTKISRRLEQINCAAGYHDDREAAAIAWKSRKATAFDALNSAVSVCYSASGEVVKTFSDPPPIVLPAE